MTNIQNAAHEICNTVGCVDTYPVVYQVAYQILYTGKVTKKLMKEFSQLQSEDVRKQNYVPAELLDRVKNILPGPHPIFQNIINNIYPSLNAAI